MATPTTSPKPPTRYVIEQFAVSVFHRDGHGIDFEKTTYAPLQKPLYDRHDGGRTEDLQEARVYSKGTPVFNPKCERIKAVRLILED